MTRLAVCFLSFYWGGLKFVSGPRRGNGRSSFPYEANSKTKPSLFVLDFSTSRDRGEGGLRSDRSEMAPQL